MTTLAMTTNDPSTNRQIWSEWLRRPDWNRVPTRDGSVRECRSPWDVAHTLAEEYWPPSERRMEEALYLDEAEEDIVSDCYGLRVYGGEFDQAELPDRIRRTVLLAAQAARSAPPCTSMLVRPSFASIAAMLDDPEWDLTLLAGCLMDIWDYDPSPMRGAVLSPPDIARLIADILDAGPPSLLAAPGEE